MLRIMSILHNGLGAKKVIVTRELEPIVDNMVEMTKQRQIEKPRVKKPKLTESKELKDLAKYSKEIGMSVFEVSEDKGTPFIGYSLNERTKEMLSKVFEELLKEKLRIGFIRNKKEARMGIYVDIEDRKEQFSKVRLALERASQKGKSSSLFDKLACITEKSETGSQMLFRGEKEARETRRPLAELILRRNEYMNEIKETQNGNVYLNDRNSIDRVANEIMQIIEPRENNNTRLDNIKNFCGKEALARWSRIQGLKNRIFNKSYEKTPNNERG